MSEGEIDVSDIDPAELLAGLYNRSRPLGMGVLQAKDGDMSSEQARELLGGKVEGDYMGESLHRDDSEHRYFDYLHGRVMKVEINGETLRTALYDRDMGAGAAQAVVDVVRGQKTT